MGSHIVISYRPANFDWMEKPGTRIRAMRKALEMNQEALAERLGVDQSTVSDIERGAGFSADLLMRLVDTLGGSAAIIMRGRDDVAWPFPHIAMERFLALDESDRPFVEGKLSAAIEEVERRRQDDEETLRRLRHRPATKVTKRRAA